MTRKSRRLVMIFSALGLFAVAVGLILSQLSGNIVFFLAPSELAAKAPAPGTRLRIGGLVEDGSVVKSGTQTVSFVVTDNKADVKVTYVGLLPDLFREGQGIVAEGVVEGPGQFRADTILAKHDENYMPKDVADALKKQGVWQEDSAPGARVAAGVAQK
jgi:cytochrome c-type biogenesis protein CcmE